MSEKQLEIIAAIEQAVDELENLDLPDITARDLWISTGRIVSHLKYLVLKLQESDECIR